MRINKVLSVAAYYGVSIDDLAYDRYDNVLGSLLPRPSRDPAIKTRLKKQQQHRDKLGRDGEAYVAWLEREKLKGTAYENGVNESFADDLSAGFDIMSFSPDGKPLYIEVKTTGGKVSDPFFLSANEKAFMEFCFNNGHRYELHRVYHMGNTKKVGRVIYTAEEIMGFHCEPCTYLVKAVA